MPADIEALFGEGAGRYLLEVAPSDADAFALLIPHAARIGVTTESETAKLGDITLSFDQIDSAYRGHFAASMQTTRSES